MTYRLRSLLSSAFIPFCLLLALSPCLQAAQVNSVVILLTSPNPVVEGQPVTVTSGVNWTASASPTGSVTISDTCPDGSSSVLGSLVLGSSTSPSPGAGFLQVPSFPCLGANQLVASYSGDSRYAPGSSAVLLETVLGAFTPVTNTLSSSLNPAAVGQNVTFTAQLSATFTNNTHPTGSVIFTDLNTGVVLGTGVVQTYGAGKGLFTSASITVSPAAGLYAVQAAYSGDNVYASATSQTLTEVVQQSSTIPTSTSLTASANQLYLGQNVLLTAQVSSGSGTPDGAVTFFDASTVLATVVLDANGQAALNTSFSALGDHLLTVAYSGSNNYTASTSDTLTVTVQPIPLVPTFTSLAASANPATDGVPFDLSATVNSSSAGMPSGTVTFSTDTATLGSAVVQNGVATVTVTLPAGTYSLSAAYSGDPTFAGSTGTLTESVVSPSLVPTTTTLVSSANPSIDGQEVTFTVTVAGADSGTPSGTVTFSAGPVTTIAALDPTGTASFNTAALPDGSNNVTAVYSGDSTYAGSTSPTLIQSVVPPGNLVPLDVSGSGFNYSRPSKLFSTSITLTNNSTQTVPGPVQVVINNLTSGVLLVNAAGHSAAGPYVLVPGDIQSGQSATFPLQFRDPSFQTIGYNIRCYSSFVQGSASRK